MMNVTPLQIEALVEEADRIENALSNLSSMAFQDRTNGGFSDMYGSLDILWMYAKAHRDALAALEEKA